KLLAAVGVARLYSTFGKANECPIEARDAILSFSLLSDLDLRTLLPLVYCFNINGMMEGFSFPLYMQAACSYLPFEIRQSYYHSKAVDPLVSKTPALLQSFLRAYFPAYSRPHCWS